VRPDKSVRIIKATGKERFDVIVAQMDGYACEEGGRISVRDTLEIPEVGYGTGHIDFIGAVRVRGDVHKGFNVRAKGAIHVSGSIAGDNIIASDTSVTVGGYHAGGNKGVLVSKGDYTVSVAEGVRAEVRGCIRIEREAKDCSLRSASLILAPRAALVGGSAWSVKGCEFKVIGNDAGLGTRIELHNALEVTSEFQTLRDDMAAHRKALQALELHLGPYAQDRRRIPLLKPHYRDRILTLVQKYDQVRASLTKLEHRAKGIHDSESLSSEARINVLEKLCAGVELAAAGAKLAFKESKIGPISYALTADGNEWTTCEYRAFEEEEP
jgi:hypothetical protein